MIVGSISRKKIPLSNQVLEALSKLDPSLLGSSEATELMKSLKDLLPLKLKSAEKDSFDLEVQQLQVDPRLPTYQATEPIDKWWREALPRYPTLGKAVKTGLSIFHETQVGLNIFYSKFVYKKWIGLTKNVATVKS